MTVPVSTLPPPVASPPDAQAKALRNMLWLGGDKVLAVVLGLLVFGLIARAYGPAGAGQFSYGVAVLQSALGLSLVCSSAALLPRLCRLGDGVAARAVGNVFVVRLAASMLATLVVSLYLVWAIDDPSRRAVALLLVATVPLLEPFHVFSAYWSSRNRNRAPVLARGLGLLTRLVVVLLALWAGASAWVVALAWVLEAFVSASMQTLSMRGVRSPGTLAASVTRTRARRYLVFAIRFALGLWLSQLFLRLDRLWLAERMDPHAFGLYATAMQLVEVWMQVATLLSGSIAPAYLYRAVRRSARWRDNARTLALLAGIGLAGLAGAALLGPWLLGTVFGPAFAASHVYLVAGCAAAVLFFIDQFAQIALTANDRPRLLALKWGVAGAVALAVLALGSPRIGALAGPLGIALGLVASWLALALAPKMQEHGAMSAPGRSQALMPEPFKGEGPPVTDAPLVSIVVGSYNYARFLRDAIDSALHQTWPALEVVVIDDGSTDGSWQIVESYGARVRALLQPNGGQGAAYNAGFAASRGEWVLFLDSDDRLDADAIARMMVLAAPGVAKVQGRLRYIDADNRCLGGVVPYLLHDGDVAPIARRFGQYASPPASGNLYRRAAIAPYLPMPPAAWRRSADTVPILLSVFHGGVATATQAVGDYRLHSQTNNRLGVLGNACSSLADALEQSRERVDKARAWGEHCTGLAWPAGDLMVPWDWRLRALSLRLDPAAHPFASDTRRGIWRCFGLALSQWPGYRPLEGLVLRAWMACMLMAPRWLVDRLAATNVSGVWRSRLLRLRRGVA